MDFGVFVCSTCAGIHREMTHKVKGFAMCNFNEKEIEILAKNGNEVRTTRLSSLQSFINPFYSIEHLKNIDGKLQFQIIPRTRQA